LEKAFFEIETNYVSGLGDVADLKTPNFQLYTQPSNSHFLFYKFMKKENKWLLRIKKHKTFLNH